MKLSASMRPEEAGLAATLIVVMWMVCYCPGSRWWKPISAKYRRAIGCASRLFTASLAFTVNSAARLPLLPPTRAGPLTTLQTSRNAADRPVAPPHRAFGTGLRPRPFPDETASLLPGLLAATRTGLPPASDDELTNTKIHHGLTSRCHLLLCWAHESSRLKVRKPSSTVRASCVQCAFFLSYTDFPGHVKGAP